jgi:hypothetical protein
MNKIHYKKNVNKVQTPFNTTFERDQSTSMRKHGKMHQIVILAHLHIY